MKKIEPIKKTFSTTANEVVSLRTSVEQETLPAKKQHNLPAIAVNPNRELSIEEVAYCSSFANVIKMYKEYLNKNGKDEQTRKKFIQLYNHNAFPNLIKHTGALGSWQTIERWKVDYKNAGNDIRVFVKDKTKRGSQVTPQQAKILINFALDPKGPLISEVIKMAMDVFYMKNILPVLSAHTYRRFLLDWKKENYAEWVFSREGKTALNDKVMPYIERDYDKIEVGDIIVADGHKLNFTIINPFTGRPIRMILILYFDMKSSMPLGWEIASQENTFAIAVALRRAIIRLGKMPKVVYDDNGRAFNANYFTNTDEIENVVSLFDRLNIKTINAIPYHGQSKTIERFFRTFSELERMAPTYVGTSIEKQPPRMNRGEKIHVKLFEKMMTGTTVDIYTAHNAVAYWFDLYANRVQQSGHLKGKTPAEVFNAGKGPGIDKRELTFLMMAHKVTTVYRNGIRMFKTHFWNEALFGKEWDEVLVRYDILEQDSVFVYDKNGCFICEAKSIQKTHPAAGILGTEEDVKILHEQLKRKQLLENSIIGDAKQFLQEEIYPAVKRQLQEQNIYQLNQEETIPEEKPKSKKKKSLIDRWGEASIEPKNKRAMEA